MPDSLDVLQRFVHGDREAFESLFREHQREVYRWALRIVRDHSTAEDAVVEAFWRAYRGRARFDPSRTFGAWMRRIVTRVAIDHLNAVRRRAWLTLSRHGDTLHSDRGAPLYGASDFEQRDEIARAFQSLSPKLQVIATLALIEEQPLGEIAEALGVPIGTVKSRLFRATRQLRAKLTRMGVHG